MKASSLRDEDRMVIWVSIGILLIGVEETDLQICIFAREIFVKIHWIFQLWEHFSVGFLSVLFCVAKGYFHKSEEKENFVDDVSTHTDFPSSSVSLSLWSDNVNPT